MESSEEKEEQLSMDSKLLIRVAENRKFEQRNLFGTGSPSPEESFIKWYLWYTKPCGEKIGGKSPPFALTVTSSSLSLIVLRLFSQFVLFFIGFWLISALFYCF